jgi:hypothetical protein
MKLQQGFGISGMGQRDPFATQQFLAAHVRFGSKADIALGPRHVRFTPESGHSLRRRRYLLSAKSGLMHLLFDHLIGDGEKVRRNGNAECFGCGDVDR